LEHKEPDKIPFDLGGTLVSGINVTALTELKKYLGMDTNRFKNEFGKELTIRGDSCDNQSFSPFGPPREVRDETKRRIEGLAPVKQKEMNWSDVDYANVTALFVLSNTIIYAIRRGIIDWIGTIKGLACSVGALSLVSMFHALANSIGQFSVASFFFGVTESGNFPGGVKAISEWFPMKERALAIVIFTAGSSI
jgi:MFS family permease